jgi:hypothetical protein
MNDSSTVQSSDKTAKNQIITTASGGNNKFFKIALILLAIVMLIIISEVGYFIFAKRGDSLFKPKEVGVQETQKRSFNITPPPTLPPLPEEEVKSITVNSDKARVFADALDNLESKNKLEPSDVAIINYEFSGTVVFSGFDKKEIDGVNYVYRLLIKRQTGSEMTFRLSDEEVINSQISLFVDGADKGQVSITDIKPGDYVVIKTIINLLDTSPHSKVILEVRRE